MVIKNFYKYIDLSYYSATPKYLQLANAITKAINEGKLEKEESLPSINELSFASEEYWNIGFNPRKRVFY